MGYTSSRLCSGSLPESHIAHLEHAVKNKRVVDLGAGNLTRANLMAEMGATVLAIDKEYRCANIHPNVIFEQAYFADSVEMVRKFAPDIAHIAWPESHVVAIVDLLEIAERLIYVGKNTDYTACGSKEFWKHCPWKPVVAYLPHTSNVMIEYGAKMLEYRAQLHHEEAAAVVMRMYPQIMLRYSDESSLTSMPEWTIELAEKGK